MSEHKHNPAHACGTCADCGGEMVWNVPRMGPAGGFVHKNTGRYDCGGSQASEPYRVVLERVVRGSGEEKPDKQKCPVCDGAGKYQLRYRELEWVKCMRCEGTGELDTSSNAGDEPPQTSRERKR